MPAVRFNIQNIIAGIFLRGLVGDSRSFENLGKFVVFSCYADGVFVVGIGSELDNSTTKWRRFCSFHNHF